MPQRVGDYGEMRGGQHFAGAAIPFNTFVTKGDDDTHFIPAQPGDIVSGVVEFDPRQYDISLVPRTGWELDEEIPIKESGDAILVNDGTLTDVDQLVAVGDDGVATLYTIPTAASPVEQSDVQEALEQQFLYVGKVNRLVMIDTGLPDVDTGEIPVTTSDFVHVELRK